MLSTKNLNTLLDIDKLKKTTQGMAVLDLIASKNINDDYIFFNHNFFNDNNISVAIYFTGSPYHYIIFFYSNIGAIIFGFDRDSDMNPHFNNGQIWNGVIDSIPKEFSDSINSEYIFTSDNVKLITFCIWKKYEDKSWNIGNIIFPNEKEDPDGSKDLLQLLCDEKKYLEYFKDSYSVYSDPDKDHLYEVNEFFNDDESCYIDLEIIEYIFEQKVLTNEIVKKINPRNSLDNIKDELIEIGYPIA